MKTIIIIVALVSLQNQYCQERIFSIGYGKTFVTTDSSTLSLTLDLNRIPGQSEKAGGYYFVNEVFDTTDINSGWGYYVKPSIDINIGSGITGSPNNISLGVPVGVVYDFKKTNIGIFSLYIDGSPELIADKGFNNNLYYFSINTYLKYEFLNDNIILDILAGLTNANGFRNQINIEQVDGYGRFTLPVFLKLLCWNAVSKAGKKYKRISWANSFKQNYVYSDNNTINTDDRYTFFNSKFDFYIFPNLGLNVTYNNGKEEPIFKRSNSISFGITLAR